MSDPVLLCPRCSDPVRLQPDGTGRGVCPVCGASICLPKKGVEVLPDTVERSAGPPESPSLPPSTKEVMKSSTAPCAMPPPECAPEREILVPPTVMTSLTNEVPSHAGRDVGLLVLLIVFGIAGGSLVVTGLIPMPRILAQILPRGITPSEPPKPADPGGFRQGLVENPASPVSSVSLPLPPPSPPEIGSSPMPVSSASCLAPIAPDPEHLYRKGVRFEDAKEYREAFRCYRQAAELGHAPSQNAVGILYETGSGTDRDPVEAVRHYRLAAEHGYAKAQKNLGFCLREGSGGPKDLAGAVEWFRKAANQGDPGAQNALGYSLQSGEGVPRDDAEAVGWYRRAAEQGFDPARVNMGLCGLAGAGLSRNEQQAVQWFRLAADRGNAPAQNHLGACYGKGLGVTQDPTVAVLWYQKAAASGNSVAQYNLGVYHEAGLGVAKDPQLAVSWYRKSSDQGFPPAQTALGLCYLNGVGLVSNPEEAVRWFEKAARAGNSEARAWLTSHGRSY